MGLAIDIGDAANIHPVNKEDVGHRLAFWAEAVIDGFSVLVPCEAVPSPVAVRYAFSQNPAGCNLYNQEGLPASPFRTDNW
jgi:sialate O-acetylesterase